jgi:hypothetical protein
MSVYRGRVLFTRLTTSKTDAFSVLVTCLPSMGGDEADGFGGGSLPDGLHIG